MKTLIQSFALIFFLGLTLTATAQKTKISGSGKIVTENRSVGSFDGLSVGGAWKVTLQKGNEGDIVITTDDNLMPHVEAYVKNGTLYIGTKDVNIRNISKMEVVVNYNDLESIRVSGACDVESEGEIKANNFDLYASGASKISLHVESSSFEGRFSGASKVSISGSTSKAKLAMSGAGSFNAYDFKSKDMEVEVSGAGSVKVSVSDHLKASVSGAGSVKYHGSPNVEKRVSGAGSVKSD